MTGNPCNTEKIITHRLKKDHFDINKLNLENKFLVKEAMPLQFHLLFSSCPQLNVLLQKVLVISDLV